MLRREFLRLLTGSLIAAPVVAQAAIDPKETTRWFSPSPHKHVPLKWDMKKPILLIPHCGVDRAEVEKMYGKYYNIRRTSDCRTGYRTEWPLHFYDRSRFTELDYKALRENWEHAMTPWALSVYRQGQGFHAKL